MLQFKECQTYICTKSNNSWFTPGEEYPVVLDSRGTALIIDNDADKWSSRALAASNIDFKLKETQPKVRRKKEMTILKRYKCIKSNDEQRFAVGEIYPLYNNGYKNYVVANNNVKWYEKEFPIIKRDYGIEFEEVKEKIFDLNKLTTTQLREYVDLLENKEKAERALNKFIERMSK